MYWRKPVLEFLINGRPVMPPPLELRVEQRQINNTLMFLSLHYPTDSGLGFVKPKIYKENTAVEIRWGLAPDEVAHWYGYVHHVDYINRSPVRPKNIQVDYVLIGNGQMLSISRTKEWREMTDSAIAQEIATKHRLSFVAHQTKKVHKYVFQDRKTDLAFVQERAAASGRRAWVENGVLYFVDPAAWAAAKAPQAPEYEVHNTGNKLYDVTDLRAYIGGDMPSTTGRLVEHTAYGVDFNSNQLIYNKAGNPDDRQEVIPDTRLDSQTDLDFTLESAQVYQQDWFTASATLPGSIKLQPGQPITFKGDKIADRLKGDWVITAATHTLRAPINSMVLKGKVDFTTYVDLARNAPDSYNYRDQTAPRIDDRCILSGGNWYAQSMRTIIL
jgi:Phage protein D